MNLHENLRPSYDVAVVGGGINGAGIARDLAGRGLSVLLVEKGDWAQHTSSASTKLIHGGLRYLEYGEFALVRKSLAERESLMAAAPHLMQPLRLVMPHDKNQRPAWMIRAGLFLYDHLARRVWLPASQAIRLREHAAGEALNPQFTRAFAYSDGWVDDARLVLHNAMDAAQRGATVLNRCACVKAEQAAPAKQTEQTSAGAAGPNPHPGWTLSLQPQAGCQLPGPQQVHCKVLVNAAGPWAAQFLKQEVSDGSAPGLRLVKGSHIVVARRWAGEHAYLFQNSDGRVLFAIPYEQDFTLIGTTDVETTNPGDGAAAIEAAEVNYLCAQASRYLKQAVAPSDVLWTYSGMRPLLDDGKSSASAVTRDYRLLWSHAPALAEQNPAQSSAAAVLTVWGGKLTTYRVLAEEAANRVVQRLADMGTPGTGPWTRGAGLPGGDLSAWIGAAEQPDKDLARLEAALAQRLSELTANVRYRWARLYGGRITELLALAQQRYGAFAGTAQGPQGLGLEVAPGLYEAELHFLRETEWATCAEDVLWRRSKLGLHYTVQQREAVSQWWQKLASP